MNWTTPFIGLPQNRQRLSSGIVVAILLAVLTWLYLRTESVAPEQHLVYTQHLRDLRELDAAIDAELLANRLEFSRNYDALTDYTQRATATSTISLVPPAFLSLPTRAQVVKSAQALQTVLRQKAELIDTFKRSNSVVRNSLAYFPIAVSSFLDSEETAPHNHRIFVDRYARAVLTFARVPSAAGRAQIADLRQKVVALNFQAGQRRKVDNLLLHGDVIAQRLSELDQLMQDTFNLRSGNLLETLNREYSSAHGQALSEAGGYRMALYSLAIFLLAYLASTFWGLDRARHLLEVAHQELSERYAAQLVAAKQLRLHATAFNNAHDGITLTDATGSILDVNPAFTRITGYERSEALGCNPRLLKSGRHDAEFYSEMWRSINETGSWRGEIWNRNKQGEVYPELLSISAVHDESRQVTNYVAVFADIGRIKDQEEQLTQMAYYDALTGLPNRALLTDRLIQAVAQTKRTKTVMLICYLDLDGFKQVNDTWGHEAGDKVLVEIAGRMKDAVRGGDTVTRLGGDEFVLLLLGLSGFEECDGTMRRLLQLVAQPLTHLPAPLSLSASIGVTLFPADDADPDTLMRHADQAMYQAKLAGKNRYHIFDATQDSNIRAHHESLDRIRLGLDSQEFVLHYQPKVNMRSGRVMGAEGLIRWQHPQRGLLPPSAFLAEIEDHPLAVNIGEWVIDTALHQIGEWHAAGLDLTVSVNIGARQLQQGDFVTRLKYILAKHPHTKWSALELEVLETSALADMVQVSRVIEECAQIGVRFALDDFGTGYSSLTYLKRLRVATLKIDQSFVRDMLDDADDLAILEGVIGLAAAFGHDVIAEGVETVAHGTALLQLGCEQAQGFGIARPMPPEDMPAWAAAWQADAAWCALRHQVRS
jgi:diguanylate cyclase (GGDEF)-like protein/PAS domain S-box-containing protein